MTDEVYERTLAVVDRARVTKARVQVSRTGIVVDGGAKIFAAEIAHVYLHRGSGRPVLRCVGVRGKLLFAAELGGSSGEASAEVAAFLRALGRDVRERRTRFELLSPALTIPVVRGAVGVVGLYVFVAAAFAVLAGASFPTVLGPLGALLAFWALSSAATVEIGADGLLVSWLWRRRFVPYEDVQDVELLADGVGVVQRNGKRTFLVLRRAGAREARLDREAIVARIDEARARHRAEREQGRDLSSVLARAGRPVREWRAALAQLRTDEVSYRTNAASEEDLWRLVENAGAPEDVRAAAALALRGRPEAAPRLRVAVETVASPRLRVALEKAADPRAEDAALDEAMEAFEARATGGSGSPSGA